MKKKISQIKDLPEHLQQALLIVSSIVQRITDKRLANSDKESLITSVPTHYKGASCEQINRP